MKSSEFLKLNNRDWLKGLVMVVISAVLTIALEVLQNGSMNFDWNKIAVVGLTAGVAYILKNLGTDQDGKMLGEKRK